METLYEFATSMMKRSIEHYFILVSLTNNFTCFSEEIFAEEYARQMILAGKSLDYINLSPLECADAISRVRAVNFDIEKGVSAFVYENTRKYIATLIEKADALSNGFNHLTADNIKNNSYLLPIWQAALNISSKSNLKAIFGSSSDQKLVLPLQLELRIMLTIIFQNIRLAKYKLLNEQNAHWKALYVI